MSLAALHERSVVAQLLEEFDAETFALTCRRAAMQLVEGAQRGWGKRELAEWLAGPYERLAIPDESEDPASVATIIASVGRSPSIPDGDVPASASGPIAGDRIVRLLEEMRADLLVVLAELGTAEGIAAFTHLAVATRLVGRAEDADGNLALVPLARRRMTLVERAMSLVAVDALVHPHDYEHRLTVCSRCGAITFDMQARRTGSCRVHTSGVVTKW